MVVIWQGYGFIAFILALIPVGTHFYLSYWVREPSALFTGLASVVAGGLCVGCWAILRRSKGPHTLYGAPIWVFGIIYTIIGAWLAVNAAIRD